MLNLIAKAMSIVWVALVLLAVALYTVCVVSLFVASIPFVLIMKARR